MRKVTTRYAHEPEDLQLIDMAVTSSQNPPAESEWQPALRDTVNGQRVIWIKTTKRGEHVWVRDNDGYRRVQ